MTTEKRIDDDACVAYQLEKSLFMFYFLFKRNCSSSQNLEFAKRATFAFSITVISRESFELNKPRQQGS